MKTGGMGAKDTVLAREDTAEVGKSLAVEVGLIIIMETQVGLTIKSLKMTDQPQINSLITQERIQGFREGEDLSHLLKMELQLQVIMGERDSTLEDLLSIIW
jgi:hypothetical protein